MSNPTELARQVEQLDNEQWYDFLDQLDEISRRRPQTDSESKPEGSSRDEVAAWVARKHLVADSSIREVWYLPCGAPTGEIRLLERSDRLGIAGPRAEAIEFGLEVDGGRFELLVADVSSELLDLIRQDASLLPAGWSLEGNTIWRRGK